MYQISILLVDRPYYVHEGVGKYRRRSQSLKADKTYADIYAKRRNSEDLKKDKWSNVEHLSVFEIEISTHALISPLT